MGEATKLLMASALRNIQLISRHQVPATVLTVFCGRCSFSLSGLNKKSYFRTIIAAIVMAIFVQSLISALRTLVVNETSLFWILYLPSIFCIIISISLIILNNTFQKLHLRNKNTVKVKI